MAIIKKSAIIPSFNNNNIGIYGNAPIGILSLNGSFVDFSTKQVSFISRGYSSNISFTSTSNISASSFYIIGINNNTLVTEIVIAPNNSTVLSQNIYEKIVSITVLNNNITNPFSIGSNGDVVVMSEYLSDNNYNKNEGRPVYGIVLNCPQTTIDWNANESLIYGVINAKNILLIKNNLIYNNRIYKNWAAIAGGSSVLTQNNLRSGILLNPSYSFNCILFYRTFNNSGFASFIEITYTG